MRAEGDDVNAGSEVPSGSSVPGVNNIVAGGA